MTNKRKLILLSGNCSLLKCPQHASDKNQGLSTCHEHPCLNSELQCNLKNKEQLGVGEGTGGVRFSAPNHAVGHPPGASLPGGRG